MNDTMKHSKQSREINEAVGACPCCGSTRHWLNNVPLTAYCWGTEDKPHEEWHKIVPREFNPYK